MFKSLSVAGGVGAVGAGLAGLAWVMRGKGGSHHVDKTCQTDKLILLDQACQTDKLILLDQACQTERPETPVGTCKALLEAVTNLETKILGMQEQRKKRYEEYKTKYPEPFLIRSAEGPNVKAAQKDLLPSIGDKDPKEDKEN